MNWFKEIGIDKELNDLLDSDFKEFLDDEEVQEATARWFVAITRAGFRRAGEELPPGLEDYLASEDFFSDVLKEVKK